MSTVASPRPSFTLSTASRRGSGSTDTTITSTATASTKPLPERGSLRRNRTALRDYYNLAANVPSESENAAFATSLDAERESGLDRADFDADAYVRHLLATEGLEGVLRVEAGLVSEVRNLDGEKKALVYDNYSKLIAATDTIRRMRERMNIPEVGTLTDKIGHIGSTARELREQLRAAANSASPNGLGTRQRQQETVRWALAAPERLTRLVNDGEVDKAEQDWKELDNLLAKWRGTRGVDELRKACLAALKHSERG